MPPPLTSAQIRAARALIRWSAEDLARHSTVSVTTIRRAELMPSATVLTRANDQAIRRALEQAGVDFIDAEGDRRRVSARHGVRRLVNRADRRLIDRGVLFDPGPEWQY
jgi:transcriptional regulator with XRE-family HTH domain